MSGAVVRHHLRRDLTTALKARDAVAVAAIRSALAAIDNAEAVSADHPVARSAEGEHIAGSAVGLGAAEAERRRLTEGDVRRILENEVHERSAAAREYERAGRRDVAERLRAEVDLLRRYLPASRPPLV